MDDLRHYVLQQKRGDSEYNDFIGKYYHFPKKYLKQLSYNNIEFIYFEPQQKETGVYFGFGKIGKTFKDKKNEDHYFAEIVDYRPFSKEVFSLDEKKERREKSEGYNYQNSVRSITKQEIDEICLDGQITLGFKADAHLIKVLGEQLIASEKVGILELIKNSYDARASYCKVRIEKIPTLKEINDDKFIFKELEGPIIVIEDDGTGMTKEEIEKGWLRPASTLKTNVKDQLRNEKNKALETGRFSVYNSLISKLNKEYKNRIPLGEKGVGRFATHRLGRNLIIKTKIKEFEYEYILKINWDEFDMVSGNTDLDSIGVCLSRQLPSRDYGEKNSGTQVIIYGDRNQFTWDEKSIVELNRTILRLNSPNPNPKNFKKNISNFSAFLECPQFENLEKEWPPKYEPTFSFDGLIDDKGVLDYSLAFKSPKNVPMVDETFSDKAFDLKITNKSYWKDNSNSETFRTPQCGAFYLHLDAWYRTSPWIDGPDSKDFIDYLTDFGGISIYRESINVFPAEWGAETDWLELSKRHIKQGFRMSYYNVIGNIEIDQTNNIELIDMTNRQGLIKNKPYNDLVELVRSIVTNIIETHFIGKRDKYNSLTTGMIKEPKELKTYTKQSSRLVSNIREKYPIEKDPFLILQELGSAPQRKEKLINLENSIKNLHKSLELIEESKDMLTEQAGYGLAVGVSIHEIAKLTSNFYSGVVQLLKSKKIDKEKLLAMQEASVAFKSELSRLGPLRAIRNEVPSKMLISKPIEYTLEIFKQRLTKLNIKVTLEKNTNFSVYARFGAITQIFSNLLDNSCYWLDLSEKDKEIIISIDSKYRMVIFADNGPGVHDVIEPYLFQPGYSMKIPPSGLGLYICRYYMQNMKGNITMTTPRDRIKSLVGAQFTLDFDKVLSEKEGK